MLFNFSLGAQQRNVMPRVGIISLNIPDKHLVAGQRMREIP